MEEDSFDMEDVNAPAVEELKEEWRAFLGECIAAIEEGKRDNGGELDKFTPYIEKVYRGHKFDESLPEYKRTMLDADVAWVELGRQPTMIRKVIQYVYVPNSAPERQRREWLKKHEKQRKIIDGQVVYQLGSTDTPVQKKEEEEDEERKD